MLKLVPRILTGLLGALLALPFALQWLLAPRAQSAPLGISLDGAAALSQMRGDTGGVFFAVGALAILGLIRRQPAYLEAVALIMASIIAGRLLSIALDGFVSQVGVAMAFELATALATFATARQLRAGASAVS
jgi:hypothetical protein